MNLFSIHVISEVTATVSPHNGIISDVSSSGPVLTLFSNLLTFECESTVLFQYFGNGLASDAAVNSHNGLFSHASVKTSDLVLGIYFL
jgi:hypothetical protein